MSGGLYDMSVKSFDRTLDLTRIKAYGDTMNDGKVQLSFTLPVKDDEKGMEAARQRQGAAELHPAREGRREGHGGRPAARSQDGP